MAENSSEFETVSQAAPTSAAEPGIFCTRCGYSNPPGRGACVMCLNLLLDHSAGANCPACGARNPSGSKFCSKCGSLIDTTAVAVFSRADLATRVLDAVGDVGLDTGVGEEAYDDEESYVGEAVDHYEDEAGVFEELEEYAEPTPVEGAKPEAVHVPDESVPGPMLEVADSGADEIAPDEDFFASAPAIVDTDEDDFAPPPPPGVVEDEEDDFAPPPAPGILEAEEDDFAPPPAPGVLEAEEDDFAPPPPPGAVDLDDDDFAPLPAPASDELGDDLPPPPPPALDEELPPLAPPAPAPEADFSAWELEADEGEDEDADQKQSS